MSIPPILYDTLQRCITSFTDGIFYVPSLQNPDPGSKATRNPHFGYAPEARHSFTRLSSKPRCWSPLLRLFRAIWNSSISHTLTSLLAP
ncbi:hypothetical protein BDN71DRAFT_1445160 [Pleurotus eryngii]|uniref:Uncharacterized protein n=1 Tax=Pleurotus eryngii TaxID=5323 RepID=A0A9P5ZZR9_PLEER|nr:hypothetical protein BDN71DRAFT_1445160 [Pleurotus eryngii]